MPDPALDPALDPATNPTVPTPPTPKRIFTATLIIGVTGSGKTSLAATFSEYLWETRQRILLLYSCDGGAFPTVVQKRVHQGLIRVWRMRTRSARGLAFETCYLASKGYWPKLIDPSTGETAPAVELIAPVTTTYRMIDPKGHLLKVVPAASLIKPSFCNSCRAMIPVSEMQVVESSAQTRGFEPVGGVFYDGLTSMSGWFMSDLDERAGRGELGGEKSSLGGTVVSGDLKFGGNNRSHFGFAQTRIQQIVHNSLAVPHLSEGPVFTALTHEVEENGQLPVVGPRLGGSAKTDEGPQWFGNVFEARQAQNEAGKPVRRLYLSEFVDQDNRRHLLKNSSSGRLPLYLDDPPVGEGPMFSQFNLGLVYRLLDQDLQQELAEPLEGAPGLPSGMMEFGEAARVETPESVAGAADAGSSALPPAPATAAPTPATQTASRIARPKASAAPQPIPAAGSPSPAGPPPPPGMRPPMKMPGR